MILKKAAEREAALKLLIETDKSKKNHIAQLATQKILEMEAGIQELKRIERADTERDAALLNRSESIQNIIKRMPDTVKNNNLKSELKQEFELQH